MTAPARSFESYFEQAILPAIAPVEADRRRRRRNARIAGLVAAAAAVAGVMMMPADVWERLPPVMPRWSWPAMAGALLFLLTVGVLSAWARGQLRPVWKRRAVAAIVRFIDPKLGYDPEGGIDRARFGGCGIFNERVDRYRTEDLIAGTVGETAIEFAEVHAEEETRDKDGRKSHRTIFRGVLFIADFNKDFHGRTFVLPDLAERLFGRIGQALQGIASGGRGDLVKLEDPEFERAFVVYSDDQVEARYILSPSLMRRILDVREKAGGRVYLAFRGSQLVLAVSQSRNLFEPPRTGSWLDRPVAERHLRDLQLLVGFVDDLNLNTRIWTKA